MTEYVSVADLLAAAFPLPELRIPPEMVPAGTRCAISGRPLTTGIRVSDVTTGSTTEFLDQFRGGLYGYVSEAAAQCFRSADPRKGNILARSLAVFDGEPGMLPLIARERAMAEGRPCWSDLVRSVWPRWRGRRCVLIISTDTKKRLWPRARVGALGGQTPVYYYDGPTAGNSTLYVDWPRLSACLELVEEIYTAGWPKAAIRTSLYCAGSMAQGDLGRVKLWERELAEWRGRSEFIVTVLIAQRRGEE